jgi:hypothetical protein
MVGGIKLFHSSCQPHNKRLERAVTRHRVRATSAPFHYALVSRCTRQRAVAQPQRSATVFFGVQCPSKGSSIT